MYTYEKFIVYPGPHYEKHSTAIQRSGVSMGEPFYLMNNKKLKNLDNCRYVVKKRTSLAAVLRWRVDIDMKYIQLYWSTHLHHSKNNNHGILIRLKNNNHVILIRPKYRIIFRCIARLIQFKKRAQVGSQISNFLCVVAALCKSNRKQVSKRCRQASSM